jgi:anti-sigma B factor antagonist
MQSDFRVETYTTGRATLLALNGELDLLSAPALERSMDELARSDGDLIVVDLRGLDFMDSTGLHVLVRAQQDAHESGRRFALIRGRDQVQRLFDLTGVNDGFTIVDAPEELFEVDQAPGAP